MLTLPIFVEGAFSSGDGASPECSGKEQHFIIMSLPDIAAELMVFKLNREISGQVKTLATPANLQARHLGREVFTLESGDERRGKYKITGKRETVQGNGAIITTNISFNRLGIARKGHRLPLRPPQEESGHFIVYSVEKNTKQYRRYCVQQQGPVYQICHSESLKADWRGQHCVSLSELCQHLATGHRPLVSTLPTGLTQAVSILPTIHTLVVSTITSTHWSKPANPSNFRRETADSVSGAGVVAMNWLWTVDNSPTGSNCYNGPDCRPLGASGLRLIVTSHLRYRMLRRIEKAEKEKR
ncbi:hypothetical protein RRG08_033871 [Elysia crispata]|uniref:Uncharacterized protein n=1 Tax=Elysia crispata TaxID=231223 RepID=A0AAE1B9A8_9GAST|nr:hypothetical protein RRG08_033871 [Elysia crispata]